MFIFVKMSEELLSELRHRVGENINCKISGGTVVVEIDNFWFGGCY